LAAGIFGALALFARALGGIASDRIAVLKGLDGRTWLLFALMVGEGLGLLLFSKAGSIGLAIAAMTMFGLFTHMACGATYALTPFIDRKALGGVAGLIGAGGNLGAVLAGFLNKAATSTASSSPRPRFVPLPCGSRHRRRARRSSCSTKRWRDAEVPRPMTNRWRRSLRSA
jgi:nitrate/nitrite transporter NarK